MSRVAEELNVGLPLVRALVKTGELRAMQVGARATLRIGATDLEDYISQAYAVTVERIAAGDVSDEEPPNT